MFNQALASLDEAEGLLVPPARWADLEQAIKRLEDELSHRDSVEVAELEGVRARLEGLGPEANPYIAEADEVAVALTESWTLGFDQADQEVMCQNVVVLAEDLIGTVQEVNGVMVVDPDLFRIFVLAVNDAKRFVQ
jgi:hypothetical protein